MTWRGSGCPCPQMLRQHPGPTGPSHLPQGPGRPANPSQEAVGRQTSSQAKQPPVGQEHLASCQDASAHSLSSPSAQVGILPDSRIRMTPYSALLTRYTKQECKGKKKNTKQDINMQEFSCKILFQPTSCVLCGMWISILLWPPALWAWITHLCLRVISITMKTKTLTVNDLTLGGHVNYKYERAWNSPRGHLGWGKTAADLHCSRGKWSSVGVESSTRLKGRRDECHGRATTKEDKGCWGPQNYPQEEGH